MAIYRHFATKDDLVTHWLALVANEYEQMWAQWEDLYPGDPVSQLKALLQAVVKRLRSKGNRGCALANSLVELPDKRHPARKVIDEHKKSQLRRIQALCGEAGIENPEHCGMVLYLCFEGAQVAAQSLGADRAAKELGKFSCRDAGDEASRGGVKPLLRFEWGHVFTSSPRTRTSQSSMGSDVQITCPYRCSMNDSAIMRQLRSYPILCPFN